MINRAVCMLQCVKWMIEAWDMWRMHIQKVWSEHRLVLSVGVLYQNMKEGLLLFETCGVSRLRMMRTVNRDSFAFAYKINKYRITIHFYVHKPWKISYRVVCSWIIVHKCIDIFWLQEGQHITIPTLYLFIAPVLFRYQGFHWKISSCLSPPIELAFSSNSSYPCANHSYYNCFSEGLLSYWVFTHHWYCDSLVVSYLHTVFILTFIWRNFQKGTVEMHVYVYIYTHIYFF